MSNQHHSGYDSSVQANAVIKSLSRQIAEMSERIAMLEAIIELQLGENHNASTDDEIE